MEAQTLGRKGNIAVLVEHGGHPVENYDPHVEGTLIGAKLVGKVKLGPHGHLGGSLINRARGTHFGHSFIYSEIVSLT